MRRLLCILDSLSAGGAETFMMKLYRTMDHNLFQMDFVVCSEGIYDNEVRALGGKIYFIPMRTKHFFGACNGIRKIVKSNRYDVVLKVGSSPIIVTDLVSAKLGGAKKLCVRTCNAPVHISMKTKVINAIFRPIMNALSDVKIAPSDLAAVYTFGKKKVSQGKVAFLHNAVDLDVYCYDVENRKQIRENFKITEEQLVIGHIGRFVKQKNHKFLINIFEKILKFNPKAVLFLIGEGELDKEIKQQIESIGIGNNVKFLGVQTNIPAWLSAMDIFVLPSLYEGMPNTVIEAQATGLSCVISETITKEANITGLVHYVSIENTNKWVEEILSLSNVDRKNTRADFIKQRYDIESETNYFLNLMFEDNGGRNAKIRE